MTSNARLNTAGTTTLKNGNGILYSVLVTSASMGAASLTLYDNTSGSGTHLGSTINLAAPGAFRYDLPFSVGLTAVVTGANPGETTVIWS